MKIVSVAGLAVILFASIAPLPDASHLGRKPAGWPSNETQAMGTGEFDVLLPGAPLADQQVAVQARFAEVNRAPGFDLAYGFPESNAPVQDQEAVDRQLEQVGTGIRDGIQHVGEIAAVAEDGLYDPLADVYDELVTTSTGAPAGQFADGQAADDAFDAGEVADEEPVEGEATDEDLERLGEMIRERREAEEGEEAPAPDDAGADAPADEGAEGGAPGDAPAEPADDALGDAPAADDPAAPAESGAVPGFILWSPDGRPLDAVVLGEPFLIELRVLPDESGLRGRQGGLREFDFVDVTLRGEDGAEHTVRLDRQDEPSQDGLVRFTAQEPISLEGTWRKPDGVVLHDGTVDALDLDVAGSEVLQVITPGVTGGATAVRVYGDPIEQSLATQQRRLQEIEDILSDERGVAEAILADSAVASNPERAAPVRAWLARTERLLDIVDVARQRIAGAEHPADKLRFANAYLSTILTSDRNGHVVIVDQAPTGVQIGDALDRERRVGEEDLRGQAWKQFTGYSEITYSLFAHGTLAAPVHQLIYGRDEFDREGSRVLAAVELGAGVAMVFLPGAIASRITEWKAGGFSLDIRLQRPGGASPGPGAIQSRPGKLAALTRRGTDSDAAYPGVLRPTPQPPRPGGLGPIGAQTAGGKLPLPGRGPLRGLDADDMQHWRCEGNRWGMDCEEANALIAEMDEVVGIARQNGVPDAVITATMQEARQFGLERANVFVSGRLDIETAIYSGRRIFLDRADDVAVLLHGQVNFDGFGRPILPETGPTPFATPAHVPQMTALQPGSAATVESVVAKSHLAAAGKAQQWTPEEIRVGRGIARQMEAGATGTDNPRNWYRVEVHDYYGEDFFGNTRLDALEYGGLHPIFTDADLEAIGAVFGTRPAPGAVGPPLFNRPVSVFQPPAPVRALDPSVDPTVLGGPSGLGGAAAPIEVVIRSTGGSTGPVLLAHFVNNSGAPARIITGALSLQPVDQEELTPEARARLDAIIEAASSGKPLPAPEGRDFPGGATDWGPDADVVTVVLDAYCLEFANDVPEEGVVFRLVDREAQQEAARFREIVGASRRLQDEGALHPDGDPESYFHSTRQWAAWTDELGLDQDGFEEAFVEHARRNFDAAGRAWSGAIEEQVRALVPNRWADIAAVLAEADRSLRRQR